MPEEKTIPVRVAVRCRPLIEKEHKEGCQTCLTFTTTSPQVILGRDKAFTYDYVFDSTSPQVDVFDDCVQDLVDNLYKGYNATVLAYGQTGSGKTHTMGGCYEDSLRMDEEHMGIIPRVLRAIFVFMESSDNIYEIKASYLEIHKEDIVDLLSPTNKKESLPIREGNQGTIQIPGLQELLITDVKSAMALLQSGSAGRTTGATAMNATSSRSHAIFTLHVEKKAHVNTDDDTWKAKFHLVDLAGSERAKKTHAEGDRFKEGVNINKGLLSLGNVISALGEDSTKKTAGHIPYRDSKLTRILQDSLGGNSHTLMIACVSPADSNMEETLNTLRYADRARKIKNKPIVNRDPNAEEIQRLRNVIESMRVQINSTSGEATFSVSLKSDPSDEWSVKAAQLEEENLKLTQELQHSVEQNTYMCERNLRLEILSEKLQSTIDDLQKDTGLDLELLSSSIDANANPEVAKQLEIIQSLTDKIKSVKDEETMTVSECETDTNNESTDQTTSENAADTTTAESKALTTQYALRQAQMQRELAELNNLLGQKQDLAAKMSVNDGKMDTIKKQYESSMKEMESQVEGLNKEKDALTQALRDARANKSTAQISEQRRKRLQELEGQLSQVKKKMNEQTKLLKIKSQSDTQVANLNRDIQSMKQMRVKLMKQMKEDADNYRKWRKDKDKQVMQLVQKDRKREFEMLKLKTANEKQKSVLKRKVDEAAAANRRLKEAMMKQKLVHGQREKKLEKYDNTAVGARVREWFSNELDIRVGVREAKYHLASMLSDRKDLTQQLRNVRDEVEASPSSAKYMKSEHPTTSQEEEDLISRVQELQTDIDLRNSQISELQSKILDAESDGKGSALWDTSIHTMIEAKCALKWLMEQAVTYKADLSLSKRKLEENQVDLQETRENCDVIKDTFQQNEDKIKDLEKLHEEKMLQITRQHEEKILVLLKMKNEESVATATDAELRDQLAFQQKEIEKMSKLHDETQVKDDEIVELKEKLQRLARFGGRQVRLMPELTPGGSKPRRRKMHETSSNAEPINYRDSEPESDADSSEDDKNDKEWERTPMFKRVKRSSIIQKEKKTLSQKMCGCRGTCSSQLCGCQKDSRECSDSCKCAEAKCVNRERQVPESTTDGESSLNSTFTMPTETKIKKRLTGKLGPIRYDGDST